MMKKKNYTVYILNCIMKLLLGKLFRIELCTSLMVRTKEKLRSALPGLLSGKWSVDVMVVGKEKSTHTLTEREEREKRERGNVW
jgi:hypothetical protein